VLHQYWSNIEQIVMKIVNSKLCYIHEEQNFTEIVYANLFHIDEEQFSISRLDLF